MKFKKEKFYIITCEDYWKPIKSLINGYSFIYEGKKWFVHRSPEKYRRTWSVTDPYTGCRVVEKNTRGKAVNIAQKIIYQTQTARTIEILMAGKIDLLIDGIKLPVNRYRWHHE